MSEITLAEKKRALAAWEKRVDHPLDLLTWPAAVAFTELRNAIEREEAEIKVKLPTLTEIETTLRAAPAVFYKDGDAAANLLAAAEIVKLVREQAVGDSERQPGYVVRDFNAAFMYKLAQHARLQ